MIGGGRAPGPRHRMEVVMSFLILGLIEAVIVAVCVAASDGKDDSGSYAGAS